MEIQHFRWLRENRARYNLGSSGVKPFTLQEIEKMGEPGNIVDSLVSIYGVERRNILITHGTQEGNFVILSALKDRVNRVITVLPEYEPIRVLPNFLGLNRIEISIAGGFDAIYEVLRRGDALFLSNPNNPLGVYLGVKELIELSQEAVGRGFYVVLDSIFLEFVMRDLRNLPLDHIIYTSSTSKFYTTDKFKIGWAVGDEEVLKRAGGILDLVSPGPVDLEAELASILLNHRDFVRERNLGIIRPNIETLRGALNQVRDWVDLLYSEHMPIAYLRIKCGKTTGTALARELLKQDVLVVPGQYFAKDDGVRVGLATMDKEQFKQATEIIINTVNKQCTQNTNQRT